jgi:hypothetical protein
LTDHRFQKWTESEEDLDCEEKIYCKQACLNKSSPKKSEIKQTRKLDEKKDSLTKISNRQIELRDRIYFENYSKIDIHTEMC